MTSAIDAFRIGTNKGRDNVTGRVVCLCLCGGVVATLSVAFRSLCVSPFSHHPYKLALALSV